MHLRATTFKANVVIAVVFCQLNDCLNSNGERLVLVFEQLTKRLGMLKTQFIHNFIYGQFGG